MKIVWAGSHHAFEVSDRVVHLAASDPLHGVCKENSLAPVIGRLGLPLYRFSGDNSVLYDHDLESYALFDIDGNQFPQDLVTGVGVT